MHKCLLFGIQIPGTIRVVRQKPPTCYAKDDSWKPLEYHNPSPCSLSGGSVHLTNSIRQQSTTGASDSSTDEQIANTQGEFSPGIKEREIDRHTGEKAPLNYPEQKTARYELAEIVGYTSQSGYDTPKGGNSGDIS